MVPGQSLAIFDVCFQCFVASLSSDQVSKADLLPMRSTVFTSSLRYIPKSRLHALTCPRSICAWGGTVLIFPLL